VSPREVFKPAILANAAALILDITIPVLTPPFGEDRAITTRLALVGEALVFAF